MSPGGKSFLQQLRETGMNDFYMFGQMRAEADAEWADAAVTIPGMRYWTSGSAPADQAWDPFDPTRGLNRPAPALLPEWLDVADLTETVAEFKRTGFHGPLNYYRAIEPFFGMAGAYTGATIRQPSFFLVGSSDGLNKVRAVTDENLRPSLPGLRGLVVLDGIGHWPQLEAPDVVNEALLSFLSELPASE